MMMDNKKDIKSLWHSSRLLITDKFEYPPVVIRIDESVVGTLGNFSATVGKAKSRKTFSVTAMTAAALVCRLMLNYNAAMPDDKRKIIYFDTEQSPYHSQKVLSRIIELSGMSKEIQPENLEFVCLRRFNPSTRIQIIEEAIKSTTSLGLVIIDGIRDLVFDINSPNESTEIISKLMIWTEVYQLHIHTVLHVNKTDDNARGHLGTELLNKAESILQVVRDEKDPNVSIVKPMSIRDVEFEPFAFRIDNDGLPEPVDDYHIQTGQAKGFDYLEISEQIHREALSLAFRNQTSLSYGELISKLIESYSHFGYDFGTNKAKKLKVFCQNKTMIFKEGRSYKFNPNFYY